MILYGLNNCPDLQYMTIRGRVTHPKILEGLSTALFQAVEDLSFDIVLRGSLESRKATTYRRGRSEAVAWPRLLPDLKVNLGKRKAIIIFGKNLRKY